MRASGPFCLSILHTVLIFVLETWLVTPRIGRVVGGVPPPGGIADCGEATTVMRQWELLLPPAGLLYEGGGPGGDGDLYI